MEKKYKEGMEKIFRQMIHCGLNLFFPKICVACRREGNYLCPRCQQQILPSPSLEVHEGIKILSLFQYAKNDPLAKLIHHWKYEFVTDVEDLVRIILTTNSFDTSFFKASILCPIPLHRNRFLWRGFNQGERLAHMIAKIIPYNPSPARIVSLLIKIRDTKPQGELNREERMKNLGDAFDIAYQSPREIPKNSQTIILIDDITTTGSTLRECAATLRKHFPASEIRAFVLARTML